MLGLALYVSSVVAALPSPPAFDPCFHQETGGLRVVEAALSDCTIDESPSRPASPRGSAGGVFVADATGRILGRSAGLLGDRVMWLADGLLFAGSTEPTAGFVLLYPGDDCDGQPYVEVGYPYGVPYSNLAMPVQASTGTWEAFVFDGRPRLFAPRSVWTGTECAKPCPPSRPCSVDFSDRQARPVRSIGPYPTYAPPFSLVEK